MMAYIYEQREAWRSDRWCEDCMAWVPADLRCVWCGAQLVGGIVILPRPVVHGPGQGVSDPPFVDGPSILIV